MWTTGFGKACIGMPLNIAHSFQQACKMRDGKEKNLTKLRARLVEIVGLHRGLTGSLLDNGMMDFAASNVLFSGPQRFSNIVKQEKEGAGG
jgi:hypothetical protein